MQINRFLIAGGIVCTALVVLIYSGVKQSARAVVTVHELSSTETVRENIRLAARVSSDKIEYQTVPEFKLFFKVHDIEQAEASVIDVVYYGLMPDTLTAGRDVIMDGNFQEGVFLAKTLLTQCPSKYESELPTD